MIEKTFRMHLSFVMLFIPTLFILADGYGMYGKQCRDNNDCGPCYCCSKDVPNYKFTGKRECDTKWCSIWYKCRRFGKIPRTEVEDSLSR